jgi:hypothetical protein
MRTLKKQKEEALASPNEKSRFQVRKIRTNIKCLKCLTRALAHKAGPGEVPSTQLPPEPA